MWSSIANFLMALSTRLLWVIPRSHPNLTPAQKDPATYVKDSATLLKANPPPTPPPTHFSYYIWRLAGPALCCAAFLLLVTMVWELTFVGLAPLSYKVLG